MGNTDIYFIQHLRGHNEKNAPFPGHSRLLIVYGCMCAFEYTLMYVPYIYILVINFKLRIIIQYV